jgi:predicted ATPase
MLTRLKVSGFKNLVDVDVSFGPFTCIAGPNGVGKSNLFDAIRFLSALADQSFIEAARSVRDEQGRTGDVRSLFHRVGESCDETMSFEVEMIIPAEGKDDLDQPAKASITFLRYSLDLALRAKDGSLTPASIELTREELKHIKLSEAVSHLRFPHSPAWRKSVVSGRRTTPFISTEGEGAGRVIRLHQEGHQGRTLNQSAGTIPRTVLSTTNAENPTVLLARREMQSWRLLQLEPSALRKPDGFLATTRLGQDGSHLPATLNRLAQSARAAPTGGNGASPDAREAQVYQQLANRLHELIDDVRSIGIDRDDKRELLTVHVKDQFGTTHAARALSDGTLRFLALSVLELDPEAQGVICLEEPENGVHPRRIPAMLRLLEDIAVDASLPVGPDNPLRQVIINTHSPAVVQQVDPGSLLAALVRSRARGGRWFNFVSFQHLRSTWRDTGINDPDALAVGQLLDYLKPVDPDEALSAANGKVNLATGGPPKRTSRQRVIDRPDVRSLFDDLEAAP